MKTKEIIDDMRKITMLTGEISSVHVQNLKTWPFVVFDDIVSVEIDYDLTKANTLETGEGVVIFNTMSKEMEKEDLLGQINFEKRCNMLASYVRNMFWKEIKIEVLFNSEQVFSDSSLKKEKDGSN